MGIFETETARAVCAVAQVNWGKKRERQSVAVSEDVHASKPLFPFLLRSEASGLILFTAMNKLLIICYAFL